MKLNTLLLILASIAFIMISGAAVYEHIAVVPGWSAAPPSSLSMFQGEYGLNAAPFWMAIHPITLILLLLSLATNWKTDRRKPILTTVVGYVIILATTAAWFVPKLLLITQTPYADSIDPELVKLSSTWELLSIVRLFVLVVLAIILLGALTRSGEGRSINRL